MNLMFWKKRTDSTEDGALRTVKLPKPREIPQRVGMYLITQLKEDPDWVWELKAVTRPRIGEKHNSDIRIFDPKETAAAGVIVGNYDSLEKHPELITYAGTFNKQSGALNIEKTLVAAA